MPRHDEILSEPFNCSQTPPYLNVNAGQMYKAQKKLLYPASFGRIVAREAVQTHYILPLDIEWYPSPNITQQFIEMIADNEGPMLSRKPKVFPLRVFEVGANEHVPENTTMLKQMLQSGTAVPFHMKMCAGCRSLPTSMKWRAYQKTKELRAFHVGKRNARFVHWESFFIRTRVESLYNELPNWKEMGDKMTQVDTYLTRSLMA